MGTKWAPEKLVNHRGMLGKKRTPEFKQFISETQKGREHQPQEGFQPRHQHFNHPKAVATRFQKGQPSWNAGTATGGDIAKRKTSTYRANAKRAGLAFEVTHEMFREFLETPCRYCGGKSSGIDRVDNDHGYVRGNMVPCCEVCNHMKWKLPVDEFLAHCRQIVTVTGYEI